MIITIESVQLMNLLGLDARELDIPQRYAMFEEIARYFGDSSLGRYNVLKVITKYSPTRFKDADKLETVWNYVRLQNERKEAIKALDPSEFEEDIGEAIKQGELPLAGIKRVREDLGKREKNGDTPDRYIKIRDIFEAVEKINQALDTYVGN